MWGQPPRLSGGPEVSGRGDFWGSPFLVSEIPRWRRLWNPTLQKAKGGAPGTFVADGWLPILPGRRADEASAPTRVGTAEAAVAT
jgi:hypothetical protein